MFGAIEAKAGARIGVKAEEADVTTFAGIGTFFTDTGVFNAGDIFFGKEDSKLDSLKRKARLLSQNKGEGDTQEINKEGEESNLLGSQYLLSQS